jgi:acetyl-CoA acetyltransferase
MTRAAYLIDGVRSPFGRYAGGLAGVRADDLAAAVIAALVARTGIPADRIDDVILGCANQAGEDNRNVARMAALLAGLPESVGGVTVNRLCASGLSAVVGACHAIAAGDGDLFVAGGTVTAGNSSGLNDGAAALVLASEERGRALGVEPLGAFAGSAVAGVDPRVMGIGPVPAVRKLLERTGLTAGELDLVELNEAFASQSLAVVRELGLDEDRVNVNGGAIAIGHPLGMSGARLVVSLLHELRRRGGRYGLATLCVGVGQGQAALFARSA